MKRIYIKEYDYRGTLAYSNKACTKKVGVVYSVGFIHDDTLEKTPLDELKIYWNGQLIKELPVMLASPNDENNCLLFV